MNKVTVTLANQGDASFEVSTRTSLLNSLRDAGEIDQRSQVALNNRQLADGYVILCVARPVSDCTLDVGVESHDKLYRNPFLDPLEPNELKADIAGLGETRR